MPVEPRPSPMRRADDARMERLEQKVDKIYDWLITEPEASPLGRTLVKRADTNALNIKALDGRVDSLEAWRDGARGSLAAARVIQVLLAILVGALAVYQFAVPK
jgi:hypothetical protein